jgi:co-chaperonin GroES (HSP10)
MEDFAGLLTIDLYNGNLYGGNLMNKARIVDKYSTIEFSDIKDLSADLYNSKLEAKNAGDLNIDSKYSKVTAISAGKLEINSYNDKYSIPKTGDIIFISKYSDLKTESSGQLKIDSYEGSFIMNDVKDIKIESKYTDFQFGTAGDISISSVYNGKLVAGVVKSLSINESKYCNYQIDELKSSVTETDGYQDKFTILKTTGDLKEVRLNGKYLEISLGLLKSTDYRFKAKINYPKLDMNESQLKTKVKISDGSQLEYDAVKGTEKEGMPLIEVSGYNLSLKIIEI